jgi:hypothetical protein
MKHKLRVFGNRVLRKIFGPKRKEIKWSGENCIRETLWNVLFTK